MLALLVRVAVIRDGCFGVVAVSCQLLVVRFAMFRDGCILVIDRIVVGVRAMGSLKVVLACKRHAVVLAIVMGVCRLVM